MLLGEDGRIAALGPNRQVPRASDSLSLDLPEAVLLPGFVNAHTHLELSGIDSPGEPRDFFPWLLSIRAYKEKVSYRDLLAAARLGLEETWSYGITTVADTGTSAAALQVLREMGGHGIYYQEVIAPHPDQAADAMAELIAFISRQAGASEGEVLLGVSPHAPYTVSPELFRAVTSYARERSLPVAVHVAESRAEVDFVTARRGPFAESHQARGIPGVHLARSPVSWLEQLGVLHSRLLAIHAVHTDEEDLQVLVRSGCAVVICPRSNEVHGHGAAPVKRYLEAGLRLALGTDSLASVPTLDLLAEARKLAELVPLEPAALIKLLTWDGARALGLDSRVGSLEPGKWADLCVVRLERGDLSAECRVAAGVVGAVREQILATWVKGRPVHGLPLAAGRWGGN